MLKIVRPFCDGSYFFGSPPDSENEDIEHLISKRHKDEYAPLFATGTLSLGL